MSYSDKKYQRALGIANFLCEGGHNFQDAQEEFRVSASTVKRDLKFLADYGYDKELQKNRLLYIRATAAAYKENMKRKKGG